MLVRVDEVMVPPRYRKDMGDIDALAKSIAEIGLLQPIVITPDKRLVCGARRLEAYRRLGLAYIEAHVLETTSER